MDLVIVYPKKNAKSQVAERKTRQQTNYLYRFRLQKNDKKNCKNKTPYRP